MWKSVYGEDDNKNESKKQTNNSPFSNNSIISYKVNGVHGEKIIPYLQFVGSVANSKHWTGEVRSNIGGMIEGFIEKDKLHEYVDSIMLNPVWKDIVGDHSFSLNQPYKKNRFDIILPTNAMIGGSFNPNSVVGVAAAAAANVVIEKKNKNDDAKLCPVSSSSSPVKLSNHFDNDDMDVGEYVIDDSDKDMLATIDKGVNQRVYKLASKLENKTVSKVNDNNPNNKPNVKDMAIKGFKIAPLTAKQQQQATDDGNNNNNNNNNNVVVEDAGIKRVVEKMREIMAEEGKKKEEEIKVKKASLKRKIVHDDDSGIEERAVKVKQKIEDEAAADDNQLHGWLREAVVSHHNTRYENMTPKEAMEAYMSTLGKGE